MTVGVVFNAMGRTSSGVDGGPYVCRPQRSAAYGPLTNYGMGDAMHDALVGRVALVVGIGSVYGGVQGR